MSPKISLACTKEVVQLVRGLKLEPLYRGSWVDCRRFFLGDRYRQLCRVYEEVIYRMSRNGNIASAATDVLESAEIRQYYDVSASADCVGLTLHDAAFREQYPLSSGDFSLRMTAGSRTVTVPLPLARFRALGTLLPLLAGNHGDADLQARLEESLDKDEQTWSRDLLSTLNLHGCLERRPIRPNPLIATFAAIFQFQVLEFKVDRASYCELASGQRRNWLANAVFPSLMPKSAVTFRALTTCHRQSK